MAGHERARELHIWVDEHGGISMAVSSQAEAQQ